MLCPRCRTLRALSCSDPWCDHHQIGEIADIEPLHVAAYIEALGKDFEKPTVKQHLAAIRMLFDWLVTGLVVASNPAHSVRGPKHVVKTGKTTVLTGEQGGKRHEMPAHHNLEAYLDAYIEAAGIRDGGKAPLFRSATGRTDALTD